MSEDIGFVCPHCTQRIKYTAGMTFGEVMSLRHNNERLNHQVFCLRTELAAAIAERDAAIERAEKYQRTAAELSDKLNGTPCAEIRWQYERAALREALKPFADRLTRLETCTNAAKYGTATDIDIEHLRNARAALDALDGTEPKNEN